MAGKFSIEAIIKAVDKFSAPIAKMSGALDRMKRSAGKGVEQLNSVVDKGAEGLKKFGLAALAAGGIAAVGLKKVIDTGEDFEHTMVAAAAKFDPALKMGTAGFDELSKAAQNIGSSTEFSSTQAAAALKDLASAGFTSKQAINALPKIVDLATAAEVDLATASDIAGKSLGAFALKTDDAAQLGANLNRVTDAMQKTANATSSSMEGLFETIKEGAPVATSAGVSLETFLAMAGQLSQAGIEGSNAGTTLKNVFLALSAPTSQAAGELAKLGIKTKDLKGNLKDPIALLEELRKKTEKMGTADRAGALETIFGRIPLAGVSALLTMTDTTGKLREQLEGAAGSTKEMANIMRGDMKGAFNSLSGALESIQISVFEEIKEPLREIVKGITDWVRENKSLIASGVKDFVVSLRDALPTIVVWLERIGRAAVPILAVAAAIKVVSLVMTAVGLLAAANPITLWIVGLTAAAALIAAFWPEITAAAEAAWTYLKEAALTAWNAIASVVMAAWDKIKGFMQGYIEFFVGFWSIILSPALIIARPIFNALVAGVQYVIDNWGTIAGFFEGLWASVSEIFSAAWGGIVEAATAVYEAFKAVWAPIADFFSGLWDGIVETFNSVFGGILSTIGSVVDTVRGVGRGVLGTGGEAAAAGGGDQPTVPVESSMSRSESVERVDLRVHGPATVNRAPAPSSNLSVSPSGGF